MAHGQRPTVIIVGAGASGILLANALARPGIAFDVFLVDPAPGRGLAYGGEDEELLLNTRAGNMSLDATSPDGFVDWLAALHPRRQGWDAGDFAPRRFFGAYLEQRLRDLESRTPGPGTTRILNARAEAAEHDDGAWTVRLSDRRAIQGDLLVLATGVARPRPLQFHGRDAIEALVQDDPWDETALESRIDGDQVLLAGSGLTALDVAVTLWRRDPKLHVVSVSRHGLLPRAHASPSPSGPVLAPPYPTTARELYAKLRASADFVEGDPALRHGVFLNLREIGASLWAALPQVERAMFLRHFRPYWDVERHRVPPAQAGVVQAAIADGRLQIVRGRLAEARPMPAGPGARVALVTSGGPRALQVGRVINCTGPETDPFRSRNPLLLDLLGQGAAAADPLGLGLQVDETCAVLNARGVPTPGLYAIGVPTQGRFFEITGFAEIRAQAEKLAAVLELETVMRALTASRTPPPSLHAIDRRDLVPPSPAGTPRSLPNTLESLD